MSREYDYESEEEFEQALDGLIEYIYGEVDPNAESVKLLNPLRVDHVRLCAAVLNRFAKGNGLTTECKLNEPIQSSAYISLEGETIIMDNTKWLSRVMALANNVEIYPLSTGGVKMTFMFYGVTREIG